MTRFVTSRCSNGPFAEGDETVTHLYQAFYRKLSYRDRGLPRPWIFTTNYDLFSETAMDRLGMPYCNGFSGAVERRFNPTTYRRHAACQRDPSRRSVRAQRDEQLIPHIERVWRANLSVYGADKVWRQLHCEGMPVARCTVERLMRRHGLHGVMRGKVVRTTVSNSKAPCPLDKVNRQFKAERPNQLWVSDFTYVSTWQSVTPSKALC